MRLRGVVASVAVAVAMRLVARAGRPRIAAQRILRVSRLVSDLDRAEAFYRDALGFRTSGRGPADPAALAAFGLGDAGEQVVMRLGGEEVGLVGLATGVAAYPADSRSNDLWFQHLAIVVRDLDAAYAHLAGCPGWTPISEAGPQTLPPSHGHVRAFKFRDPDGHPLELLWFPQRQGRAVWHSRPGGKLFLGIDHSALAVASIGASLRHYRALGLRVSHRSWNHGPAQSRLDGLPHARVRVIGLRPRSADGPGLELLAYYPPGRGGCGLAHATAATDWVCLEAGRGGRMRGVRDPDGHRVLLTSGDAVTGAPA